MDYFSYLIFLVLLSALSVLILLMIRILDLTKAHTEQKITFIKISLILIFLAFCIFVICNTFSWKILKTNLSSQLLSESSSQAAIGILNPLQTYWSFYPFVIYVSGVSIMLLHILFSYISAKKQLAASIPSIIQGQSVYINENIHSPLSFGLPIGKIYFPVEAESKWSAREIQMSLAHEKIHLAHHDSFWKTFSLFVRALLFFAPWSYLLHRRLVLEMEITCDKKTCIETNADIKEYGNLLLSMTSAQPKNLILTNLSDTTLKRRLLAMKSKTIKRPLLISVLATASVLATSAVIAMTSGIIEKDTFDISSKIYIDGKLVSSPRIVTHANQLASIVLSGKDGEGLRMDLTARNAKKADIKGSIVLSFDIEYKSGKESIHTKPVILVNPDQEGRIKLADSAHSFEMHVVAKKE